MFDTEEETSKFKVKLKLKLLRLSLEHIKCVSFPVELEVLAIFPPPPPPRSSYCISSHRLSDNILVFNKMD